MGVSRVVGGATSVSHLSGQRQSKLLNLIGKKCIMDCSFNGVPTQVVWDTGSQVNMISEEWRRRHLPHTTVRSIDELVVRAQSLGRRRVRQPYHS